MKRAATILMALVAALTLALPLAAAQRFGIQTIPLPGVGAAEHILAVPALDLVFVVLSDDHRVVAIDATSDEVVAAIETGPEPQDQPRLLAFDPARNQLLVHTDGRVRVYSALAPDFTPGPVIELQAGPDVTWDFPLSATWDPLGGRLLLTDYYQPGLGVVEGGTAEFRVELADDVEMAWEVAVDPTGNRVIVPDYARGDVKVLRASDLSIEERLVADTEVTWAEYEPGRERVYWLLDMRYLVYFDLASREAWAVDVGRWPRSMVLDQVRDQVYVGSRTSPFLYRVDGDDLGPGSLRGTPIVLPAPADVLALDGEAGRLWAIDKFGSQVTIVDTATGRPLSTWATGPYPRNATVDPRSHKLYTSNFNGPSVSVFTSFADPRRSEVTVDPEFIPGDGLSTSRVTVFPVDELGNPLGPGHRVVIRATAGTLVGSVVDVGDGTYIQDLRSTTLAETAIVTAAVDGDELDPTPRVSFVIEGHCNLRRLEPEWGLTSGNEPVTINGTAFLGELRGGPGSSGAKGSSSDFEVYFGDRRGRLLAAFADRLECETPAADAPGVVDVRVVKWVGGAAYDSYLRGGFTYVESEELTLRMADGPHPGEVLLHWSDGPAGPVRVERSPVKDFAAEVSETVHIAGTETTELTPVFPRLLYFRVER